MQSATAILTGNLPAEPNSFIGRERDLAELARLLGEVRALTLSGLGGIGKTRLAVRLARDVLSGENPDEGPGDLDEAWLVELADWHGPVAQAVATTLGVREEQGVPLAQTLAEALRSRHMLLILDTCEHQVSDCATLVQLLLARCPWLRIIATSREPLRVRGETVWRVPPLDLPPDGASGAELAAHEAVRLFAARAAGARPGFTLTGGQHGVGGAVVPDAGRHPAGHRAVRGPGPGAVGGADRRPAAGPVPAAQLRRPDRAAAAADAAGHRGLELSSCWTPTSRCCCGGWRPSPAGTWTWPSRCARTRPSGPTRSSGCSSR